MAVKTERERETVITSELRSKYVARGCFIVLELQGMEPVSFVIVSSVD